MTDITILHSLQKKAIEFLLDETFTITRAIMHERYVALGKENARLLNQSEMRFVSGGIIYPPNITKTIPYGSCIPNLHYSLLGELSEINNTLVHTDYGYIKNFFIATISQSHNAIVLDALLPSVLIDGLKRHFRPINFKIIDTGVYGALQQEPLSVTQQNIQDIKNHYKTAIANIRYLLMDKLLLQK